MTNATTHSDASDAGDASLGEDTAYEWAPTEPAQKKRRAGWWIGGTAAVAAVGLVAASLVLIAPGTAIAGVPVGFMTPGAAVAAVEARLANTEVVVTTAEGTATLTGADLGASVDATASVETAFAEHPMWNVTQWFAEGADPGISLDAALAESALADALPASYSDPVAAVVTFDEGSASYTTTPAIAGSGIDLDSVQGSLHEAFLDGSAAVEVEASSVAVEPTITTALADESVATLNQMLDAAGFYVGDERVVPIDRAVMASWLTVENADDGSIVISADANAIQATVDTLPDAVNRAAVDADVVTNTSGTVLRTISEGVSGRALESTEGVAADFAAQLATGNAAYTLPVAETEFATVATARSIEVNLGEQRLYVKENGNVIDSWLISSGAEFPTNTGTYSIGWKTTSQTMRGYNADGSTYAQPDVKWAMYFNGDQAFHGVYWHDNFGTKMSHGCVGMPEWRAQWLYDWSPEGVTVTIYN